MAVSVTIEDRKLRKALRLAMAQVTGRKPWKVATIFKRLKSERVGRPWRVKGLGRSGKTKTWAPLSDSVARSKSRGKYPIMWWSNDMQTTTTLAFAKEHYEQYMIGGGHMVKTPVPMSDRYDRIMYKSGEMRKGARVGYKKNAKPPYFEVYIKGLKGGNRYPYYHLHGVKSRTGRLTHRRKRKAGRDEKGQWIFQDESITKTYTSSLPKREWAVWLKSEEKELAGFIKRWFAGEFRR